MLHIKNVACYSCELSIFSSNSCSNKQVLNKKLYFDFIKKTVSAKVKMKPFQKKFLLIASITCHIFNRWHFSKRFNAYKQLKLSNLKINNFFKIVKDPHPIYRPTTFFFFKRWLFQYLINTSTTPQLHNK